MVNRYNIFKYILIGAGASFSAFCFFSFAIPYLEKIQLAGVGRIFSQLSLYLATSFGGLCLVSLLFAYWKGALRTLGRSCLVTYRLRRFGRILTSSPDNQLDMRTITDQKAVKKKFNHSLQTLTAVYTADKIIVKWRLPHDHENKKRAKQLLPEMKAELQEIDGDFVFSDFEQIQKGWYQAIGTCIK